MHERSKDKGRARKQAEITKQTHVAQVSMTSFDPQSVEKNSRAAAPLADWVILIILYNTRLRERRASQKV